MKAAAGLLLGLLLAATAAGARTLPVGADRPFKLPSDALAAARDGDTVSIAPGTYFDCAIVRANGLTITGEGDGVVLTDKVCEEKAILVLRGDGMTVRNMTLQRVRAPDGNGAGIRLESADLTVDRVHFINDQVGILSGATGGTVSITDSTFERGGVGGEQPKYAIMIERSTRLRVSGCAITDVKGGGIRTAADRSEIVGNTIGVGAGEADERPALAVLATGGDMLLERNTIRIGPTPPPAGAAIGLWDEASGTLRGNTLVNTTGQPIALLQDWTSGRPVLSDNTLGAGDSLETSGGLWRHRASREYYARKLQAHALASQLKQLVKQALGR